LRPRSRNEDQSERFFHWKPEKSIRFLRWRAPKAVEAEIARGQRRFRGGAPRAKVIQIRRSSMIAKQAPKKAKSQQREEKQRLTDDYAAEAGRDTLRRGDELSELEAAGGKPSSKKSAKARGA
jgi:hypothetical protein